MPRLRHILFLLVLIEVSGCSSEIGYELYNSSGASITINNCEGDQFIAAGEQGVIYGCRDPGPAFLSNERKWTYTNLPSHFAESDYVGETRLGSRKQIKLQLEPSGLIMVVKTADEPPVRTDYTQPPGFPIRPDSQELLR